MCVCVCVCTVMVLGNLNWNFATWSYSVHLDNCFFVNIVSCKILACCYGSNDINRNNSGATNLQGFFFNGKENSKTKNTLFICNYGNTNTRKTQEDFIIGTWEALNLVVLGKGQSWDGIYVLGR